MVSETGTASTSSVCSKAFISSIAAESSDLQKRDIGEKSAARCSCLRVHARKNGFVCECFSRLTFDAAASATLAPSRSSVRCLIC